MAANGNIDVGQGVTLTFGTSSHETNLNVTGITWSGISRGAVEITDLSDTTSRKFMPTDLYDPGELSVSGFFEAAKYASGPIYAAAAETVTVTFPAHPTNGAGADTFAASMFRSP